MYTNNGDDMDLKRKYAHLLLDCLNLKKGDYLFVSIPTSALYFKKLIIEEAEAYGLKDIYFDEVDSYKKHDLLKNLDQENINKHPYFDASIYNKYAKLDAGFLFIRSMIPKLMDDVDPVKIKATTEHTLETQKYFRDLYNSSKLRWNISCIPNEEWAKSLNMSEDELWNYILKICMVDEKSNPYEKWNEYLKELEKTTNILNDYNFEYLFTNRTDKQSVLERTQKIFYVCCTRAKENLAVFYHNPMPAVLVKAKDWFGENNVKEI